MHKWVLGWVLAIGLAGGVWAQDSEIKGVISGQIEAFKADDFEQAFTFAAPSIRQIFRTPENFGVMVRRGYPMVWRPSEVTFLDLREQSGSYVQTVRIEDAEGAVHLLAYAMTQTPDGWRISGVQILEAPGVST
ncbi:DUF4864 domain-containing protein [uncultured Tateyamaria sp.]|uniref:DUF4864 domain-containing protein n=1 Tax=Tateyamaria sp. 1078 TaxID=3417464 RepID=UPI002614166B|nr:DUF4864 domain-containing protein [uncultured Tateyamaria sp.]